MTDTQRRGQRVLELGAHAQGAVLDEKAWACESRIRTVRPARFAAGEVRAVFPYAPRVVAVLADGETVLIRVQP